MGADAPDQNVRHILPDCTHTPGTPEDAVVFAPCVGLPGQEDTARHMEWVAVRVSPLPPSVGLVAPPHAVAKGLLPLGLPQYLAGVGMLPAEQAAKKYGPRGLAQGLSSRLEAVPPLVWAAERGFPKVVRDHLDALLDLLTPARPGRGKKMSMSQLAEELYSLIFPDHPEVAKASLKQYPPPIRPHVELASQPG